MEPNSGAPVRPPNSEVADGGRRDVPVTPGGGGGESGSSGAGGAGGDVGECKGGAPCPIADKPCLVGSTVCDPAGKATCMETSTPQANGSPCGDGMVCLDGACSGCNAGIECPLPDVACRAGVIDCSTGKPECTEIGNAPNGTGCGQGMVCKDGACTTCAAGDACVPTNRCHEGALSCTGGTASCTDTGRPSAAGTTCGVNQVCNAGGDCVACTEGMSCPLPTEPCKVGKIGCSTGAPVCSPAGDAPNGTACGSGQVCSQGTCVACGAGMACVPTNKCHTGTLSCESGMAMCKDSGMNAPNGTSCGTNMYCSNGNCAPCTPNASCTTSNPCKTGTTTCETGTSQCRESGNQPNGRSCGNGRVCSNGACVDCQANMACQPSACKVGTTTCASGASRCTETGNAANGMACGNGMLCNNGSCVTCQSLGRRLCNGNCVEGNCCGDGDCSGGFACVNNRCSTDRCRTGLRMCGTSCVDGNCCGNGDCTNGFACTGNRCSTDRCADGSQRVCGGRCVSCPNVPNGTAGCASSGASCVMSGCNSGFRNCGGACVTCPNVPNGTSGCDGTRCVMQGCNSGFENCSGTCSRCPSIPNGRVGCQGNSCQLLGCLNGTVRQGDQCVSCGGRNQPCCSGSCSSGTLWCNNGTCEDRRGRNETCSSNVQCVSNRCLSNHCCNTTDAKYCDGACRGSSYCCGNNECAAPPGGNGRGECNAGSCRIICNSGYQEVGGRCRKRAGQPCSSDAECASNSCPESTTGRCAQCDARVGGGIMCAEEDVNTFVPCTTGNALDRCYIGECDHLDPRTCR